MHGPHSATAPKQSQQINQAIAVTAEPRADHLGAPAVRPQRTNRIRKRDRLMRRERGALLGLAQARGMMGRGSGGMNGLRGREERRIGGKRRSHCQKREGKPDNGSGDGHIADIRREA